MDAQGSTGELGRSAVRFEKLLAANFIFALGYVVTNIWVMLISKEGPTNLIIGIIIWTLLILGFCGAYRRNQTVLMVWLCIQGCFLCCGIITVVVLVSSVALIISPSAKNDIDLTGNGNTVEKSQGTVALGVINLLFAVISFIIEVVACAVGVRLNTLMAHAAHTAALGTHTPDRVSQYPQFPYGHQLADGDEDPATAAVRALSHNPITVYDVDGNPFAIAIRVDASKDPLLLSDAELATVLATREEARLAAQASTSVEASPDLSRRVSRKSSKPKHAKSSKSTKSSKSQKGKATRVSRAPAALDISSDSSDADLKVNRRSDGGAGVHGRI